MVPSPLATARLERVEAEAPPGATPRVRRLQPRAPAVLVDARTLAARSETRSAWIPFAWLWRDNNQNIEQASCPFSNVRESQSKKDSEQAEANTHTIKTAESTIVNTFSTLRMHARFRDTIAPQLSVHMRTTGGLQLHTMLATDTLVATLTGVSPLGVIAQSMECCVTVRVDLGEA